MLLPLLLNLGMFTSTATGGTTTTARAPDGSAGRKRHPAWWEGEWIIPGVTHYLPEKPPEDITPLRPKVDRIRRDLQDHKPPQPTPEYLAIVRHLASLTNSVNALERRARKAVEDETIKASTEAYRRVAERYRQIEKMALAAIAAEQHRRRIAAEDDQILQLIAEFI